MKKLRLLITKECNQNCEGCCNKEWDLDNLPVCTSFEGYDEVILTGGEPTLNQNRLLLTIKRIRKQNKSAKIYMYTADICGFDYLNFIDGLTFTLHYQHDVFSFVYMNELLEEPYKLKSLRLNVFEGINLPDSIDLSNWKVRKNIKWIKNCPLPKDEVFMRLEQI